ncbi:MAG: carbohydrate kinase family protein [Clostridia bacterium]|jgi:ribokinase|nr:carbohydrate kinase family protein [Clostridia bacterium]MDD4571970.1 carbohydrate kinase family protein [Clostridia bacterium]
MQKKSNSKNVLAMGTVAMDIVMECTALPKEDGFGYIEKETLLPGGSSANLLVALHNLGAGAYQTGKIGDDEYGKLFRKTLVEDGVDDTYLVTKAGGSTLHTYIMAAPNGKHAIFASLGDCVTNLEAKDLPNDIIDKMDVFYTDMFSARASLHLAQKALRKPIPVLYNMQCVPSFMETCGVHRSEIEQMLGLTSLFASGRDGYHEMTGEKDYQKAMSIVYEKYKMPLGVICTAGDEGAAWLNEEGMIFTKAYPVEAVDSTGAGDCFLAGLIYSYFCKGKTRAEAMNFAAALASLKCLQKGPRLRTDAKAVKSFMNTYR